MHDSGEDSGLDGAVVLKGSNPDCQGRSEKWVYGEGEGEGESNNEDSEDEEGSIVITDIYTHIYIKDE